MMKQKLLLLLAGVLTLTLTGCGIPKETTAPDQTDTMINMESSDTTNDSTKESQVKEPEITEELRLQDLFAEHNMKVGTCLTTQMIKDKKQSDLILSQFNSVTMENDMKPDYLFSRPKSLEAGELVVDFKPNMITLLDWAKENNMAVRGHTLVWYSQTPEWIFHEEFDPKKAYVGREEMLKRMESYIRQIFEKLKEGGYTDIIYAYDVVNEAWMEDGSIRKNNWTTTIGDDYLWYAFYFADKYAPEHIDLYYNDYNEQFKEDTLVQFVKTLVDENGRSLIDGIGLQGHLYTMDSLSEYFDAIDKLAATGLKLQVTELDVSLGAWQNTLPGTEENLKIQGKFYYDLLNGLFERADNGTINTDALTFWGFADHLSWRGNAKPLLYDSSFKPKYAYYGAMQKKELAGFDE